MKWKLHSVSQFREHSGVWDTLRQEIGAPPFLGSQFIAPLIESFSDGSEVVAFGSDGERVDVALIVKKAPHGMWQTFQPSQLPLGPFLARHDADVPRVLRSLLPNLPGFCLGIGLTQMDPAMFGRPVDAALARTTEYIQTAWVEVDADFETYWAARGKNLRQNLRKQRTRLEGEGVKLTLVSLDQPDDLESAIRRFGELEAAGWKGGAGTAVRLENAQGRFYLAMLRNFCGEGGACVYEYRFNDQIVAMDLCIKDRDSLVILKTAYDESIKGVSPAFLMRQEQFEDIFAKRSVKRIEFFGKMMEWHTRWTDRHRGLYHLNAFRNSWIAGLHDLLKKVREGGANAAANRDAQDAN